MHPRLLVRATALVSIAALTATLLVACAWRPLSGSTTVSGTITLPEGVELGDDSVIDVSLHRPGDDGIVAYTLAEADGRYLIADIPSGEYVLYVSVLGANIAPQYWGGATRLSDAATFRVGAGTDDAPRDVTLLEGATLSGTISMPEGSKGGLRHAWVSVWDAHERSWKGDSEVTERGTFAVSGLAAGEYKVQVSAPRGSAANQWWGGASDWVSASTVDVDASGKRSGVDVALTAGGAISGVVGGAAAAKYGASVYATLRAPDGEWEDGSWVEVQADGSYTLRGLAPGSYAIMFSRPTRDRPCQDADSAMVRQSSEAEPPCSTYWPDRPDIESAELVDVTEGATVPSISADLDQTSISTP